MTKTTSSRCRWPSVTSRSRRQSLASTIHPTSKFSRRSVWMKRCPQPRCCSELWNHRSPDKAVVLGKAPLPALPRIGRGKKKGTAHVGAVPIEHASGRLADPVNLCPADWASSNSRGLAVLHGDGPRVFHLDLSFVLQTIAFHLCHRLTDFVDLGPAVRASPNCRRLAVLHRDRLGVFHFDLSFVLQAVTFQSSPSLVEIRFWGWTH